MLLNVFSVLDKATGVFTRPFFMLTRAEAIRSFTHEVNNPESDLNKNPLDYHLYHIAEFDQDSATFTSASIVDLGNAGSYINTGDK